MFLWENAHSCFCLPDFLGLRYDSVTKIVSKTKPKLFLRWEINRKNKRWVSPTKQGQLLAFKSMFYPYFRKICVLRVFGALDIVQKRERVNFEDLK